jgi:hypothetical protein
MNNRDLEFLFNDRNLKRISAINQRDNYVFNDIIITIVVRTNQFK